MKPVNILNINNLNLIVIGLLIVVSRIGLRIIDQVVVYFSINVSLQIMTIIAILLLYIIPILLMYIGLRNVRYIMGFCVPCIAIGIVYPMLDSLWINNYFIVFGYILAMSVEAIAFGLIGVGIVFINGNKLYFSILFIVGLIIILVHSPLLINYSLYAVTGDNSYIIDFIDSLPT